MTIEKLRRDRRGGSYVLVSAKGQPWRHEPRVWEIPTGGKKAELEDRVRVYSDDLARYRVWLLQQLRTTPAFLDPLRGRRLACPCAPGVRCPTDILLEQLAA
jgi:hypothetical protein